jgi:hypothetical protein
MSFKFQPIKQQHQHQYKQTFQHEHNKLKQKLPYILQLHLLKPC